MSMECRLCLQAPGSLPLGDLAADLVYCCGLQVDADDGLPDHICSGCGHLLNQSTKFKRQCETSDRILRKRLGKNGNKLKYNESNIDNDEINQDNDSDSNSNFVQIEIKEEPILFDQEMDTNTDTVNANNIKPETVLDDENLGNTDQTIKVEETSHHSKSEPSDILKDDESMECRSTLPTSTSNHPALFVEIPSMSTSEKIDYDTMNEMPATSAIAHNDEHRQDIRKRKMITKKEFSSNKRATEDKQDANITSSRSPPMISFPESVTLNEKLVIPSWPPHEILRKEGQARRVRRSCSRCYKLNAKYGRKYAKNRTKQVVTYCSGCDGQPHLCLPCFNTEHKFYMR